MISRSYYTTNRVINFLTDLAITEIQLVTFTFYNIGKVQLVLNMYSTKVGVCRLADAHQDNVDFANIYSIY